MRAFVTLLLCALFAACSIGATALADPVAWPNRGPYRTVGDPNEGYPVNLPASVVAAVQRQIPDPPARWITHWIGFPGQRKPLLQISGWNRGYAILFVKAGAWVNLSTPASMPFLNQVLERLRPSDLQDRDKLETYVYHIVFLQKHGLSKLLTPELQRERFTTKRVIDTMNVPTGERQALLAKDPSLNDAMIDTWLGGTEKSRQVLLALFHPLVVTRDLDRVTVGCNVMTSRGAVEQWTFHLRVDQAVRLEGVDVREIYPEGTFFFPLVL